MSAGPVGGGANASSRLGDMARIQQEQLAVDNFTDQLQQQMSDNKIQKQANLSIRNSNESGMQATVNVTKAANEALVTTSKDLAVRA